MGGALVASPQKDLVRVLSKSYPGRASASPIIDLVITLLELGTSGLQELYRNRISCLSLLVDGLAAVGRKYSQRLLLVPENSISIGLTISPSTDSVQEGKSNEIQPSRIGSMVFIIILYLHLSLLF